MTTVLEVLEGSGGPRRREESEIVAPQRGEKNQQSDFGAKPRKRSQ